VVGEDDEVARIQHMTEMLYSLIDCQQLVVVSAVFLLGQVEFVREESEGLPGVLKCCCSTASMADVEASVTSANGVDGSGCASRVVRNKRALHSSKALWSVRVQVLG
jgi:hypothetical protein